MATRRPLYYDSGNLKEMSDTQVNQIIAQVSYQYSLNPSVTLAVSTSGGTLSGLPINDTRYKAGNYSTSATSFPGEGTTQEPQLVTVSYARLTETVASTTEPTDVAMPIYSSGGNIRSMTKTDVYDTFIHPAINNLALGSTGTAQGGTYRIHTSTSLAGHTLVSSTPVFIDTRWNTSASYTVGDNSGGNVDQPTTITNFYLFVINGSESSYTPPVYITIDNQLQTHAESNFNGLLQNMVRHAITSTVGYRINYNISGTGNNRGSGMTNTILNGSGNYQTRFVNTDDYRAQEFPNGSPVTDNTYYLRINQS